MGKYFLYCMNGETNLKQLIKNMKPALNKGEFVFITVADMATVDISKVVLFFKEEEGYTLVVEKHIADEYGFTYGYVAAWITLTVHSSLEAVGLTAAFSNALAGAGISCNVMAAYYHDHIFVDIKEADNAIKVLQQMTE